MLTWSRCRGVASAACALALALPLVGARPSKPAAAPADSVLRLETVLESIRLAQGVPGLAAAVVEGGRVIAIGAAGVPYTGATRALTVNDPLHIGSCTKSMTALAIAELVEKHRLQWSTTLADAFPELLSEILPVYRNVRLDQLLTHRGSIPAYEQIGADTLAALNATARTPVTIRYEFVRRVVNEAPVHDPGARYDYSNAGYTLAAAMAENVTGKPWEYWLKELVFAPLGMGSAGFGWPADKAHPNRARGHQCPNSRLARPEPLDTPYQLGAVLGPGGDVHASIADLARYIAFHLNAAEGRPTKPSLAAATWHRLHEDPDGAAPGYAMGWYVQPGDSERPLLFHDGTAGTFYARLLIEPGRDRAVVIATNAGPPCGQAAINQALDAVLKWVKQQRK